MTKDSSQARWRRLLTSSASVVRQSWAGGNLIFVSALAVLRMWAAWQKTRSSQRGGDFVFPFPAASRIGKLESIENSPRPRGNPGVITTKADSHKRVRVPQAKVLRFGQGGERTVLPVNNDQSGLFLQHFVQKLQGFVRSQRVNGQDAQQRVGGIWRGFHRHFFAGQAFIDAENAVKRRPLKIEFERRLFFRRGTKIYLAGYAKQRVAGGLANGEHRVIEQLPQAWGGGGGRGAKHSDLGGRCGDRIAILVMQLFVKKRNDNGIRLRDQIMDGARPNHFVGIIGELQNGGNSFRW